MVLLLIVALIVLVVYGPGLWVKKIFAHYSQPRDRYPMTGAEMARRLLDRYGLQAVPVETTEKGDHYDLANRAVRLQPDHYNHGSLTAITIAAHEVGHAVQHLKEYQPLVIRYELVRRLEPIQKVGAGFLMLAPVIGVMTRLPGLGLIMFIGGFLTLGSSTVVHLFTLPTEFDASFGRAMPMLEREEALHDIDTPHARRLLRAAAYTYVAGSLAGLLNIARWWAIVRR